MKKLLFLILFVFVVSLALRTAYLRTNLNFSKTYQNSDIEAIWKEGQRICQLENPYSRILSDQEKHAFKPPIYLPGYYYFSCVIDQVFAVEKMSDNLKIWSIINAFLYVVVGLFFIYLFFKEKLYLLGLVLATVFFFSRWSLHTLASLQINFIAILPLLLSFYFFEKKKALSCLLFGVSLALKQVAVFLLPLYCLTGLKTFNKKYFQIFSLRLFLVLLIPVALSIPFIFDDFAGFYTSLMHSTTREANIANKNFALETELRSLLVVFGACLIYYQAYTKQLKLAYSSFLVMLVFIAVNKVFFTQYYLWLISVLLYAIYEVAKDLKQKNE